jgi:hypothetical protein
MGKGKFIHASSGGGKVQVNSLSDSYYNRRYVTGRRVVKSAPVAKKAAPKPPAPKVKAEAAIPEKPVETAPETPTPAPQD